MHSASREQHGLHAGHRNSLHHTDTVTSEKSLELEAEAESILEAIEVGSNVDSPVDATEHDLEKAATEASGTHHEPATKTVTAQDWNGPDDPENPQNWSLFKRSMHIFPIAFLSFGQYRNAMSFHQSFDMLTLMPFRAVAVTAGSSMISPAVPLVGEHFHVSRTASILSLSLFVLGLGVGPTIAAPISEMFGRSVVYKTIPPLYMLFILGAGLSKTFGGLLVCRLLAGMAGGPVLAIGAGTNADLFPAHIRAVGSSFYVMAPFLGPGQ